MQVRVSTKSGRLATFSLNVFSVGPGTPHATGLCPVWGPQKRGCDGSELVSSKLTCSRSCWLQTSDPSDLGCCLALHAMARFHTMLTELALEHLQVLIANAPSISGAQTATQGTQEKAHPSGDSVLHYESEAVGLPSCQIITINR